MHPVGISSCKLQPHYQQCPTIHYIIYLLCLRLLNTANYIPASEPLPLPFCLHGMPSLNLQRTYCSYHSGLKLSIISSRVSFWITTFGYQKYMDWEQWIVQLHTGNQNMDFPRKAENSKLLKWVCCKGWSKNSSQIGQVFSQVSK